MADVKVEGNDLMLFVGNKPIAFATSCKLTVTAESKESSSKDSGIWAEKYVGKMSWTVTSENIYSETAYDDLFDKLTSRTPVAIVFGMRSGSDKSVTPSTTNTKYSGNAIITSLESNAPLAEKATFTITLEGTGELIKTEKASDGGQDSL
ncbi:MAG: phage tail tube protein [Bacteroidales bacterium]|nr:phage tail tube protein [Bacteroidales bacterium]